MWANSIHAFPLFSFFVALTFFYMHNNADVSHNSPSTFTKLTTDKVPYRDFTHNILLIWVFLTSVLLTIINFFPLFGAASPFFIFNTWRVGLVTYTVLHTIYMLFLLRVNLNNLRTLLYNEFFLVLLLYLPGLYLLMLGSSNIIVLYILLEVFAVLFLVLLYTSSIGYSNNLSGKPLSRNTFFLTFYQFVFNFYSSLFFALMIIFLVKTFGVISYMQLSPRLSHLSTLLEHKSGGYYNPASVLPILFIIFFFLKFGVGPWFAFKLHLYQFLQPTILFIYLYIYFMYLLPYGIWLVYSLFHLTYFTTTTLSMWFIFTLAVVFCMIPRLVTLSTILSLSSVLFYLFILSQLLYIL